MSHETVESKNSFDTVNTLTLGKEIFHFYDLQKLASKYPVNTLPYCMKILLENLLRHEDGVNVQRGDIESLLRRGEHTTSDAHNIAFSPARVVLQDFTGVPAVVDLAAMRDAMIHLGGDPNKINPKVPVDLVIDHSVMVDYSATKDAFSKNVKLEFERNGARYQFLRWGQQAFNNFRAVPPGTGIVHQVNLEYLAKCVMTDTIEGKQWAFPDTLVGTDSHTTMINGLGVLGWGVGGIEAEAGMLGQPISMLIPDVVGFQLLGELSEGATATDLVLTITQILREAGVVGKFVEFFGSGLSHMSLADRATVANMAPEYGATCGIFPIDDETIRYLTLTGRDHAEIKLVADYAKHQGLWRNDDEPASYTNTLSLDLSLVKPSLAGPKRPQDRVELADLDHTFNAFLQQTLEQQQNRVPTSKQVQQSDESDINEQLKKTATVNHNDQIFDLTHGDIVIAAITSCTNTSNPSVMIAAGLVAKKARALGLTVKPWVKTSLAPGSQVVPAYLEKSGLQDDLDSMGFNVVGFGCTTCIGNSGPLAEPIREAIQSKQLVVASVLSGNRNFEGRIHSEVRANYLCSPPLVVAYALAGTVNINLTQQPISTTPDGKAVFLKDVWPSSKEIQVILEQVMDRELFLSRYSDVFEGNQDWQALDIPTDKTYTWPDSTYIKKPPFFEGITSTPKPLKQIVQARCLVKVGDSITTDHISPAGSIHPDSPAGQYLLEQGVKPDAFNSLGSRRGNHEVMMRGTFANVRLKNQLAPGKSGGFTTYLPTNELTTIYEAAQKYQQDQTPLIVLAGKEYGTGSSRDWAAKGTKLLGIMAVIAESFERIHRSNLVGFGVLPLQFLPGQTATSLGLQGTETFAFAKLPNEPSQTLKVEATDAAGHHTPFEVTIRIDTDTEWEYFFNDGILNTVLRKLVAPD